MINNKFLFNKNKKLTQGDAAGNINANELLTVIGKRKKRGLICNASA